MRVIEQGNISRRRFVQASALACFGGLVTPNKLFATNKDVVPTMMEAAASAVIRLQPLRRNISVLEGSGGNIAVLTGADGTVLIDAGLAVSQPAIVNALASINADPVKHLINTHWHIDHTDGNAWLNAAGAGITAHENTRKHLSAATRVEGWNWTFPAAPQNALPTETFADDHKLCLNKTNLVLEYFGPAHTDSDISVRFVEADILHVGDTWWNGAYPFIDYSTGGSIDGSIRAAEANVRAVTGRTIVIPGHGPVGNRSELIEFRDMLVSVRNDVAELKKQGRTLAETVQAKPTSAFDAKWGQFLTSPEAFTKCVYVGV